MKKYRIAAIVMFLVLNIAGCGGGGGGDSPPTIPAIPTNVTATAGNGEVTVDFDPVAGATSYNIYWDTSPGVTIASGTQDAGGSIPRIITGLIRGTEHYFVVTAVNSAGESGESIEVSAVPDPPAPTFSLADLNGFWNIRVLQSGTDNGWYSVATSVASGVVNPLSTGGPTTPPSIGPLSITTEGVVTDTSNATFHGKMSSSKNLIVGTSTRSGTSFALHIFVKDTGVTYSATDLANKDFAWNRIQIGSSPFWEIAEGFINPSGGQITLTYAEDSTGVLTPQIPYSTITIDANGNVELGKEPSFRGVMTSDKKMIIGTSSDPPYGLMILQMRGQTYIQNDLGGTSDIAFTFHSDSTPSWDYATWSTDPTTGDVTGSNWLGSDTGNTPLLNSWALDIDADGFITTSGDLVSVGGWLSYSKDLAVVVGDSAPDGSFMTIKVQ